MDSHVLSVGQCSADDYRLGRALSVQANAHLARAASAAEALRLVETHSYDLVLVNRIFDGDGESGVEFIRELKKSAASPCVMLVSDYADAQADAVAAGALRGFGKSNLESAEVGQLLREALHSCARAGARQKA